MNATPLALLRTTVRAREPLAASLIRQARYRSFGTTSSAREEQSTSTATPRNAIKDAERALSRAQKLSKMSGMSGIRQEQPLQDIVVLPPLKKIGFNAVSERRKYVTKRIRRGFYTAQSISKIVSSDIYSMKTYDHPYKRFWGQIAGFFYPQKAASGLLSHFSKVWEGWSRAIASGDMEKLKEYSKGSALEYAKSRASAASSSTSHGGPKIEWAVNKYLSAPRIVHARNWVIDPKTQAEVAQVIVRFETEQTLTIHQRNKPSSTRSSRISECWVFERYLMDPMSKWQIRDKVTPFTGGEIPETLI
ncbi:hypothetical protein HD553DRAFT_317671 [Filobasidium floriforme]|uniref:uncharacterized protein n=1 Tax=Filobasidium floriforme TaxID=5210 RepID=UPI001E8E6EE8|nr:uncharacterized protein HD553DRAFT_317671 [Filobasidium floriforme]KAH8080202.1 hypothetical protein HD553DRAFT_317671 [Filobasidium floriforme]